MSLSSLLRGIALLGLILPMVACNGPDPASVREQPAPDPTPIPATPYGDFLAGMYAQSVNDYGAAATYYDRALEALPVDGDYQRRAFLLMAASGDLTKAAGQADIILQGDEDFPYANLVLYTEDVKNGDFARARGRFDGIEAKGIFSFLAPLLTAWAVQGQGDTDGALEALQTLLGDETFQTLYDFHAGLISELAGRRKEAAEFFKSTLDSPTGLSLIAADAVAAFHMRGGDMAAARAAYDKYGESRPGSQLLEDALERLKEGRKTVGPVSSAAEGAAQVLFGTGLSLQQSQAPDQALILFRLALALQPDFPMAQYQLADALEGMGRYEEANGAFKAIREGSLVSYSANLRLAGNLYRIKQVDKAIAVLEQAAADKPTRTAALHDLGDIFRVEERWEESYNTYTRAIERIDEVQPFHWQLFFNRGIAYEQGKVWDKAEKDLLKALELNPDQPHVLNYLGYSWIDMGMNMEKAEGMIKKAVEKRPRDGFIADSLGWVYYLTGKNDDAVTWLERAVELEPGDPIINDHFGDALWRVGRKNEARFQWQRSLTFKPKPDLEAKIKVKLEKGLEGAEASP